MAALRDIGVDYAQGFAIGAIQPLEDVFGLRSTAGVLFTSALGSISACGYTPCAPFAGGKTILSSVRQ